MVSFILVPVVVQRGRPSGVRVSGISGKPPLRLGISNREGSRDSIVEHIRQQHAPQKGFVEPLVRSAIVGVIALVAIGMGLPNWLAIAGLLVASALAGVERHGLTSDAVYWAISNYLVAITASKLAHLIIIGM
jgi:hypothetical protein